MFGRCDAHLHKLPLKKIRLHFSLLHLSLFFKKQIRASFIPIRRWNQIIFCNASSAYLKRYHLNATRVQVWHFKLVSYWKSELPSWKRCIMKLQWLHSLGPDSDDCLFHTLSCLGIQKFKLSCFSLNVQIWCNYTDYTTGKALILLNAAFLYW